MAAEERTEPESTSAPRAFWRAATRPSGPALALTLLVCAGWFAAALLWVDPMAMGGAFGYVVAYERDDYGHTTWAVARRRAAGAPDGPTAVLIGASANRESFSDAARVEAAMSAALGRPATFVDWTTSGLTLWESNALVEALPEAPTGEFRGVVAVGVGFSRFRLPPWTLDRYLRHRPRLGLDSAWLDAELATVGQAPERWGPYAVRHRSFLTARFASTLANLLWRGVPPRQQHRYVAKEPVDPATLGSPDVPPRYFPPPDDGALYAAHHEAHFAVLGRLMERTRARYGDRVHLVLLLPPVTDAFVERVLDAEVYAAHVARLRALAAEHGYACWSLDDDALLTDADFFDAVHVQQPAAQERYADALGRAFATAWRELEGTK